MQFYGLNENDSIALAPATLDEPGWMQDILFSRLSQIRACSGESLGSDQNSVSCPALPSTCVSAEEARGIVTDAIVRQSYEALSTPAGDIDTGKPLRAYGGDSLVAVELPI